MEFRQFSGPARRNVHPTAPLLIGVLLLASMYPFVRPAHAQVAVGGSTAGFLNFEVGAKSSGMAGVGIGLGGGVTSQYWNPAFLADLQRPEVGAMHASWLNGLSYEWLGYARPMGPPWGVGSLSVAYFHMPSLMGYDAFDNPTSEFKVYDMALTAGLARAITPAISAGANARFIRQNLANVSGTGAAVDIGLKGVVAGTTLGAAVQNLGPDLSLGGTRFPLPWQVRFGASHSFHNERMILAADYNIPRDYYKDIRIGAEVRPYPLVAVRLGYRQELGSSGDPLTGLSFGLGLRWKQLAVDYAMTPDDAFDNVQRLSFGYSFGGGEEKAPEPEHQPRQEKPEPPAPPAGPKVIARANPGKPPASATPATPAPVAGSKPAAPAPAATEPTAAIAQVGPAPKPLAAAPKPASKGVLYDVVLGSFQSEEGARSELKALDILGFQVKDAKITPQPDGGYRLSLARFGSKKSADDLASSLTRMSFQPRVEVVQR